MRFKLAKPSRVWPNTRLFDKLCDSDEWIAEPKKNGWRCAVRLNEAGLELFTRAWNSIEAPLPGIREGLRRLSRVIYLDCELQHCRGMEILWVFDVIHLDNKSTINFSLRHRREILLDIIPNDDRFVRLIPQCMDDKRGLYYDAVNQGDEGVVFKKRDSAYPVGDTVYWIKCRVSNLQNKGDFNGR